MSIFPSLRLFLSLNFSFFYPKRSASPGETKLLASEIYEILQSAGKEEAEKAEAAASSCRRKAHFFLGSNNKKAKTVVLHIDGLDDSVSVHRARSGLYAPYWSTSVILAHTHRVSVDGQKSPFRSACLLLS